MEENEEVVTETLAPEESTEAAETETTTDETSAEGESETESLVQRFADTDARPAWLEAALHASGGKPIDIDPSLLKDLPIPAQNFMHNVHLELAAAKEHAARLNAEMEAHNQRILDQEAALLREKQSLQDGLADRLEAYIERKIKPVDLNAAPDPDSPAGRAAAVQRQVYDFLMGFKGAIAEFETDRMTKIKALEAEAEAQQRLSNIRDFVSKHHADGAGPLADREVAEEFVKLKDIMSWDDALDKAIRIAAASRDEDDSVYTEFQSRRRTMRAQAGRKAAPKPPSGRYSENLEFFGRHPEAEDKFIQDALKLKRGL